MQYAITLFEPCCRGPLQLSLGGTYYALSDVVTENA